MRHKDRGKNYDQRIARLNEQLRDLDDQAHALRGEELSFLERAATNPRISSFERARYRRELAELPTNSRFARGISTQERLQLQMAKLQEETERMEGRLREGGLGFWARRRLSSEIAKNKKILDGK